MRKPAVSGIALVSCALAVTGQGAAQRSRFSVYGNVGVLPTLAKLNSAGTASLQGGLYAGGGLNWQVVPNDSSLVLQGDVMWTRQTLHTVKAGSGTKVDLIWIGANLEYTWLQTRRCLFTVSGGGGVVAVHPQDSTAATRARPFARLGLGARYVLRPSVHLFVQGFGLMYDIQNFPATSVLGPYTHRQSEAGIGAGVSLGL